jgi:hypothetical protein
MPSSGFPVRIFQRATTQRNLTIIVAILTAVPTAYAFQATVGDGSQASSFLLLMTLAVGVPTAYDEHWPQYDRSWKAIAWVLVASGIAAFVFTGSYILAVDLLEVSPWIASVGAFLVTDLGGLVGLATWKRNRD